MKSCLEYRDELERAVENRIQPTADVLAHLKSCNRSECQEAYEVHNLLHRAIPAWKSAIIRSGLPSLRDEVIDILVDTSKQTATDRWPVVSANHSSNQTHDRSPLAAVLSVAAVLLMCAFIGFGRPAQQPSFSAMDAQSHSNRLAPNQGLESGIVAGETDFNEAELEEMGAAYGRWMKGAAEKLTDTMTVVLLDDAPETAEPDASWFTDFTNRIEPLESQLGKTWKFLIEEVQQESDDQTRTRNSSQNEYFGLFLSKSASVKELFTLILV